eukprot:scaffold17476_cov27-Phaeocystis_antarctica.AAC.1
MKPRTVSSPKSAVTICDIMCGMFWLGVGVGLGSGSGSRSRSGSVVTVTVGLGLGLGLGLGFAYLLQRVAEPLEEHHKEDEDRADDEDGLLRGG